MAAAGTVSALFIEPSTSEIPPVALAARRSAPEAPGILLIDAGKDAAPLANAAFSDILIRLAEFGAARVVLEEEAVETPSIHGSAAGADALRQAFDAEFDLIEENMDTLVNGMRLGSVRSRDVARYVAELKALSRGARDRLVARATAREEAASAARAAELLGNVYVGRKAYPARAGIAAEGDSAPSVLAALELAPPAVAVRIDRSAPFESLYWMGAAEARRAGPLEAVPLAGTGEGLAADAVFAAFLDARGLSFAELDAEGFALEKPEDGTAIRIPWFGEGKIAAAGTGAREPDPRRLPIAAFLAYAEAEKEFRAAFSALDEKAYLTPTPASPSPSMLIEHADGLEKDFFEGGDRGAKEAWTKARARALEAGRTAASGPDEARVLAKLDATAAAPGLDAAGSARVAAMRAEAVEAFARARRASAEMDAIRKVLQARLPGATCIIARDTAPAAALWDALEHGAFLRPASRRERILVSGSWALAAAAAAAFVGPAFAAAAAAACALGAAATALLVFAMAGAWFSPVGAALPAAAAGFVAVAAELLVRRAAAAEGRRRFAGRLPRRGPGKAAGDDGSGRTAAAALLAVRMKGIAEPDPGEDPRDFVARVRACREGVAAALRDGGGMIASEEGELVFACFEEGAGAACRTALRIAVAWPSMAARAGLPEAPALGLGVDEGSCVLGDAGPGTAGYEAFGAVPVRARLLSALSLRYGVALAATEAAAGSLDGTFVARPLDSLVARGTGEEERFFAVEEAS